LRDSENALAGAAIASAYITPWVYFTRLAWYLAPLVWRIWQGRRLWLPGLFIIVIRRGAVIVQVTIS